MITLKLSNFLFINTQAGGSPLEARSDILIYIPLILGAAIIFVFGVFSIFLLFRKRIISSPEWLEKEKARPTKWSDIVRLSKVYSIPPDELSLLWEICKKYKVLNIYYSIRHFNDLDTFFKEAYDDYKKLGDEQTLSKLFTLKFDMDKIFQETANIPSTAYLTRETKTSLILHNGEKIKCSVVENTKDYIAISFPEDALNETERPAPLSKTAFTFLSAVGMPYAFVTRVIRYEKRGNDLLMILSHSSDLVKKSQRRFKRQNVNSPCQFASVKETISGDGKVNYEIDKNKFPSVVQNISGGGCCITSNLPIKEGQAIYIEFNFGGEVSKVIGKIVKTRKAPVSNSFNLHIRFVKITFEVQNKILAKVYSYE